MRAGLAEALRVHGGPHDYPAGSIVLCAACYKPLYRLTKAIPVGAKVTHTLDAYRPLTADDLKALAERAGRDGALNAGLAGLWRSWTPEQRVRMAQAIPDLKTGSQAWCPFCENSWVFARAVEGAEVHDRAYTRELITLAPETAPSAAVVQQWGRP